MSDSMILVNLIPVSARVFEKKKLIKVVQIHTTEGL